MKSHGRKHGESSIREFGMTSINFMNKNIFINTRR